MRHQLSVVSILLFIFISGCTHNEKEDVNVMPGETDEMLVNNKIAESADKIEKLWASLGRLEQSRDPGDLNDLRDYPTDKEKSGPLQRSISIEWSGELTDLVKRLAKYVDYPFKEVGKRPSVPIFVNIKAENETVASVLREVGYQAGRNAGVIINDGPKRSIELIYGKQ